ncbi:DNA methyltransferase [Roseibium sp. Sym1]|uniref:DNA methyltransferase n=1 Tax=Roseibium sp. Sym1 TaxID=3016006 RepID=UPI0022B5B910|nr:DNA methyltransferase [Roseibium sp. Sym1]
MTDALVQVCPARTVLAPFAGSGTTGLAALRAGRRFVGCERERAYYEIASERLSKAA